MAGARILNVEDEPIIAADLADRLVELGSTTVGSFDTGEATLDPLTTRTLPPSAEALPDFPEGKTALLLDGRLF